MQADEVRRLLDELVSDLGFRVSPAARTRLERALPGGPDEFVHALLDAAGIEPATCDRRLLEQLRARVGETMRGRRHGA